MSASPGFKAISLGALVILGGYRLCMVFVSILLPLGPPKAVWTMLAILAAGLAMASGAVGAYMAHRAPIRHGVLAGFSGGAVLLLFLGMVAPTDAGFVFLGPIITVTLLAFAGALFTVYIWPRRGVADGEADESSSIDA